MAIKTFASGEVLTAADTNTYLANSGLVFIKSQTIGSAVASVQVTSAFSADFDNYRIVVNGGVSSADLNMRMILGASTTAYYSGLVYVVYTTATPLAAQDNNSSSWGYVGYGSTDSLAASFDVINPFAAKFTQYHAAGWSAKTAAGMSSGIHQVASSQTSFTLSNGGTFTGGTITVYGYRKG